MVSGMATAQITITLHDRQLQEIRALVAAGWKEMLADALCQTGGPLTRNERDWADALLSPRGKRSPRKGKAA